MNVVDPSYVHEIQIALPRNSIPPKLLFYPDGTIGVEHLCIEGMILAPKLIRRKKDSQRWDHKVLSWDPITIEPSVLCPNCFYHGWIRNGMWEPIEFRPRLSRRQRWVNWLRGY